MNTDRLLITLESIEEEAKATLERWACQDPIMAIEDAEKALHADLLLKKLKTVRSIATGPNTSARFCSWYARQAGALIEYRPWEHRTTSAAVNLVKAQHATTAAWLLDRLSVFVTLTAVDAEE